MVDPEEHQGSFTWDYPSLGMAAAAAAVVGLVLTLGVRSAEAARVGMAMAAFGGPTFTMLVAWHAAKALGLPFVICQFLGLAGGLAGALAVGVCLMMAI